MEKKIEVASSAQAYLKDKAEQEHKAEQEGQEEGTMADLFAGRVGTVSGSSELYSENGGQRFLRYLIQKHNASHE